MFKRLLDRILLVILVNTLLTSCSNDLDLIISGEPIPVVYFVFNPEDTVYSVTLTHSFEGTNNAYNMAKNPDSVYFSSAEIKLEGWAGDYKAWESAFNLSNIVKEPGIFPSVIGHCYQTENVLSSFDSRGNVIGPYYEINSFRLFINSPELTEPVYSRIPLVRKPIMATPRIGDKVIDLYPPQGGYYFVSFEIDPEKITYCELVCVFRYEEFIDEWIDKTSVFPLRENIQIHDEIAKTFLYPDLVFNKIATNIELSEIKHPKRFNSLDLLIFASDNTFHDYQTTYINTGNMDNPPMGNIVNGIGIFSMIRVVRLEDMYLSIKTKDSLVSGQFTRHLGFVYY